MNKKPIKIIKKKERLRRPAKPAPAATDKRREGNPTDLAKTVSEWVREFRNRSDQASRMLPSLQLSPRPKTA